MRSLRGARQRARLYTSDALCDDGGPAPSTQTASTAPTARTAARACRPPPRWRPAPRTASECPRTPRTAIATPAALWRRVPRLPALHQSAPTARAPTAARASRLLHPSAPRRATGLPTPIAKSRRRRPRLGVPPGPGSNSVNKVCVPTSRELNGLLSRYSPPKPNETTNGGASEEPPKH